jgi:hypothetical protein
MEIVYEMMKSFADRLHSFYQSGEEPDTAENLVRWIHHLSIILLLNGQSEVMKKFLMTCGSDLKFFKDCLLNCKSLGKEEQISREEEDAVDGSAL